MPSEPRSVAWHPEGRLLGVLCAGGHGVEIDVQTRGVRELFHQEVNPEEARTASSGECTYSPDGRIFAAWGFHQRIHLFDRLNARELIPPIEPLSTTLALSFHGNTAVRAVGASEMQIRFHDTSTGAATPPPIPYVAWPFVSRFNETGELLLTAGGGGLAQLARPEWMEKWREFRKRHPDYPGHRLGL